MSLTSSGYDESKTLRAKITVPKFVHGDGKVREISKDRSTVKTD
jgi:hypothetical protein